MKIITDINQIHFQDLEQFVYNHPNGNFFQSTKAYQFFQSVENYEPIFIVAKDNDEIVGSLLAVCIREGKGLKRYFSRRCIVWGGPLFNNDKVALKLLTELVNRMKNRAIYIEIRNLFDLTKLKNLAKFLEFTLIDHLNVKILLEQNPQLLLEKMHKERRHNIRRAINKGLDFEESCRIEDVEYSYKLIKQLYKRIKLPLPPKDFFIKGFIILAKQGYLKIFTAKLNGIVISVRFILCYKDILYDWYVATDSNYLKYYPNDFLPYKIMEWGIENGYKVFDFGGAGRPNTEYGVRDYKLKFGGELVNYGRYLRINNKLLYNVGKLGLKILKLRVTSGE